MRSRASGVGAIIVALVSALGLMVTVLAATVGLPPRGLPSAAAGVCDPTEPASCTLRELAEALGLRVGATAEPHQITPGPYATTLAREFNSVTPENALKWYTVQASPGAWEFGPADAVVAFAEAHGLEVRGHTLVWAQDSYTPAWVRAITDPDELRARVTEQIETVMTRYRGRIHRWDVVNEPLASVGTGPSDSVFWEVLGPGWVADAFRTAHEVDPDAELWLNEYGTDWVPGKHAALVAMLRDLIAEGVPVHGVGLQMHRLGVAAPDPTTLQAQLRDFTDLGLEVAITELDIPTAPTDPDALVKQAEAYARIVDACLAVAGCREITTWGLTDASTWLDALGIFPTPTRPLLFDDSFQPKPAYHAVRERLAAALRRASTTTTSGSGAAVATPPAVSTNPRFTG
jgi:endo-1,4-beta-xylanase